jgi:hypothetical protein
MVILLVATDGYFINGYQWLFNWWLLMTIGDYPIDGY